MNQQQSLADGSDTELMSLVAGELQQLPLPLEYATTTAHARKKQFTHRPGTPSKDDD
jgi:hypothetical protein